MTSPSGDVKPTTPLPWRAIHGAGGPCVAGTGRTVAALGPLEVNDPDAEDHANAALIVRRVNAGPAADALAEAVERIKIALRKSDALSRALAGSAEFLLLYDCLAAYRAAKGEKP